MPGIAPISRAVPAVAHAAQPAMPRGVDARRVKVSLVRGGGRTVDLGTATEAIADRRLSRGERQAIANLVKAVRLLRVRARLAGLDDAGAAVRLVLRESDAQSGGPWATVGQISVGRDGAFLGAAGVGARVRPGTVLPVDVALHELAHAAQFSRVPKDADQFHAAIGEGIADVVAMLASNDRTLGEGFFRGAPGGPLGSIRSLEPTRAGREPLGGYVTDFNVVRDGGVQVHEAGGVVVRTFDVVWRRLGRARAEQLVWAVIRDDGAWSSGGAWQALASSILRMARSLWPGDAAAEAAVLAALRASNLHEALPARDR